MLLGGSDRIAPERNFVVLRVDCVRICRHPINACLTRCKAGRPLEAFGGFEVSVDEQTPIPLFP